MIEKNNSEVVSQNLALSTTISVREKFNFLY